MKKSLLYFSVLLAILGIANTITASINVSDSKQEIMVPIKDQPVVRDCYWLFDSPYNGNHEIYDCQSCLRNFVENPRIGSTCTWPGF
jgi:hypothetical protein